MSRAVLPCPTPRQRALLARLKGGELARLNLLCGSVRSGKTWGSLLLWAAWAQQTPVGAPLLMVGKTRETLRRNCLGPLARFLGKPALVLQESKARVRLFGHEVILMGAADERAESRLRGATLLGAYCDEVSLFPESFFAMLLSRLSAPGARLFATTNPEHPGHWLKRRYLDRAGALDLHVEEFLLEDNPHLDAAYVANLRREYTGAFYERYVLGRWVAAQGAVYPLFAGHPEGFLRAPAAGGLQGYTIQVGVDFGGSASAFAFVAVGVARDFSQLWALASRRVEALGVGPEEMYRHIEKFLAFVAQRYGPVNAVYADCAEPTLINGMRRRLSAAVRPSRKHPILQRVRAANLLMSQGRFWITADCESLRDALQDAVYAPGGADARLDDGSTDVDSLDAFEYAFERYLHPLSGWRGAAEETKQGEL